MVKIRLARVGRKNYATYKVVAVDSEKKRNTKFIEELGSFQPHTKEFKVDADRVKYWLSVGAQPTGTVARQLVKAGLMDEKQLVKKTYKAEPGQKSKDRKAAKEGDSQPESEAAPENDETEETPDKDSSAETPKAEEPEATNEDKAEETDKEDSDTETKE